MIFYVPLIFLCPPWYLGFCFKGVEDKSKPGLSSYEKSCLNAVSTVLFCHFAQKKNNCSSLDEL